MKHLYGLRTFVGTMSAILALVVGLWLLKEDQRGGAYLAFGGSVVAALSVLGAKSTLTEAANGEGLIKAGKNIFTTTKPGDPS